ncbi:MAG: hypothetical protein GX992_09630 [Clostridium sp.]|nr:hypothetical protein [Clostridium sp.]
MQFKTKKKFKVRLKLGGIMVFLFLILYIPSFIYWIYNKNICTDVVRNGEIEQSINIDALIVRDEYVIDSPSDGIIVKDAQEGEKVRAGDTVATILNKASEGFIDELKVLDLRIIEAQREKAKNDNFFSGDIKNIDAKIEENLMSIIIDSNKNTVSGVKKTKNILDDLIQKKATIAGELSIPDAHITSLKAQKQILQESINQNKKDIVADMSGIISFSIDGCEGFLNKEAINAMTLENIKLIEPQDTNKNMEDLNAVFNKPVAKIVSGIDYYIVFIMDKKCMEELGENIYLDIRINDINKVIDGNIEYRSEEMDGKFIVAIRTDKALSDTATLRKINVDIINSYCEGLKVPVKSLTDIDTLNMTAKIGLVRAGRVEFVPIKLVGINKEFAIIDNMDKKNASRDGGVAYPSISLYSSYIVNPKNIEEGQMVN